VPDRRRTFDYLRHTSTLGEVLEAHHLKAERPSLRAVIDHRCYAVRLNGQNSWDEDAGADRLLPAVPDPKVWQSFIPRWHSGEYIDTHCWVFTPDSFVDIIRQLADMGLISLAPAAAPVDFGFEFIVHLTKTGAVRS
jgi:hypothetical protein